MAGGAVLAALLLTGCQLPAFGAYRGDTTQGQDAFKLWQGFFIAGSVVFLIVFFLIVWAVIRYRHRSDAVPAQTQYHTLFEITYTVVPIIFVLVLFGFTFATENNVDAVTSKQVTVNVTAFQWGWEFQYPTYDVKVLGVEPTRIADHVQKAMKQSLLGRGSELYWNGAVRRLLHDEPDVLE